MGVNWGKVAHGGPACGAKMGSLRGHTECRGLKEVCSVLPKSNRRLPKMQNHGSNLHESVSPRACKS